MWQELTIKEARRLPTGTVFEIRSEQWKNNQVIIKCEGDAFVLADDQGITFRALAFHPASNFERIEYRITTNARFWIWWNNDYVKITLRPWQEITIGRQDPTDEGYEGKSNTYLHDGDVVRCKWSSWGQDCDGYLERNGESVCPLSHLHEIEHEDTNIKSPEWTRENAWQRDQYAEAMGECFELLLGFLGL